MNETEQQNPKETCALKKQYMEDSPTDQYGKMNNSVNIAGEIIYF